MDAARITVSAFSGWGIAEDSIAFIEYTVPYNEQLKGIRLFQIHRQLLLALIALLTTVLCRISKKQKQHEIPRYTLNLKVKDDTCYITDFTTLVEFICKHTN